MGDPAPENGGPRALEALTRDCRTIAIYLLGRTHKPAFCKRGSVNVRFAPKAAEVLRCRELARCANGGHWRDVPTGDICNSANCTLVRSPRRYLRAAAGFRGG